MPDQDYEPTPEQTDEFMNMNFLLTMGVGYQRAAIIHRKSNSSGKTIGKRNANPLLDTRVYEAELPDGKGIANLANTAATSLFDNCSYDGNNLMLYKYILNHKSNMRAVQRYDVFVKHNGSNS